MNKLLADADICVKCGLCLPTCPTYLKTQNENESPRGRIALIQAWAGGYLQDAKAVREHIDNCLLCRECERVCPAVMPYSELIDNFRSQFFADKKSSVAASLLNEVAQHKAAQRFTQLSLKLYQTTPLQKIARTLKLPNLVGLAKVERLLSHYHEVTELADYYPTTLECKGTVGLFIGCMGTLLDFDTITSAIKVLTAVGFNVAIPSEQTCCGALALHNGDSASVEKSASINCTAFGNQDLTAIVTIASGCGGQLQAYAQTEFADKVMDISQFLVQADVNLHEKLQPLAASVCLHTPCSLKNVMRAEQGALQLLQQIPELKISKLPKSIICCGSAGSYMIEHAAMAEAILADLLDVATTTQANYLVSSNIGCVLHISAGLQERGITMEVLHPVVLIARQLKA
jgi:glycolate oxidase iron-sulfur subunit